MDTREGRLIHHEELRHARQALGIRLDDAAKELNVSADRLQKWEAGYETPSLTELEKLAGVYGRGVDYFLAERPQSPSAVFLRTSSRVPASQLELERRKALVEFEELCRAEWELELILGQHEDIRIEPRPDVKDAADLAELERARLGLDSQPVGNLRATLGREGIRVFELPIPEDTAGMSWWHSLYGPCVLVNLQEPPGRRNFTMAHEYGHLLRGAKTSEPIICEPRDLPDSEIPAERFADRYAAHFLMPRKDLLTQWQIVSSRVGEEVDATVIQRVSQRYQVSPEALAIRLEELGLLPAARWLVQTVGKIPTFGRRRPDWRRVRGERFVGKAIKAYSNDKLSIGKLAQVLGIDLRTARDVVNEYGSRAGA